MSTTAPAPATPELAGLAPSAPRDDPWWRTAVVYQIYIRSFRDSTGTGTGDLGGVLERLPYLRRLGVDAIWLSPFYPSPQHDHGYDVADYEGVDPRFGDLDLMRQVIDHAHALGLRVMIDIVPNHCSTDHPWFRAALAAAPESPERALFHFADGRGPDGAEPPNNWRSIFGGSSWARTTTADGTPGQYYLHSFAPEQADFNWADPRVGDYFESILRFWLDLGVDGFRIDVAHGLHKQPGLPDDPQAALDETTGDPVNSAAWNRPEVHDVWRRWRALTDAYEERDGRARVLVGEIGVLDPRQVALYQRPDELHQSFLFEFLRTDWDATAFHDVIRRGMNAVTASGSAVSWVLNNHDMPRVVTRYAGGEPGGGPGDVALGERRARAALLMMLALPGSVYLYQGEELGLAEVVDLPVSALQDPMYHRSAGARRGRDGCRVPLPWQTDTPSYGFTSASAAWLPQPRWFSSYGADEQQRRGESTLHLYRAALALRSAVPDFRHGELVWHRPPDSPDGVVSFRRGRLLCTVNCGPAPVPAPEAAALLLSSAEDLEEGKQPPHSAAWWLV
ncbi:glycoside hydrolase family 13 protein [Streptomyces sp. NBC_01474]|uniref:glycoside hydrolase family 13 protein n=1 Tax=Streptomyces sp. NBC_01474 TaxID=2903880 RepID=UPI002DDA334C|nr:glycoside hydrolase family 13 protein [Streptomyces sp. NBC_01474]WSE00937.1 glycoside hydrolase family 13 protein [Streptomyces sp. NBC_01474]